MTTRRLQNVGSTRSVDMLFYIKHWLIDRTHVPGRAEVKWMESLQSIGHDEVELNVYLARKNAWSICQLHNSGKTLVRMHELCICISVLKIG